MDLVDEYLAIVWGYWPAPTYNLKDSTKDPHYPHKCPHCKGPAYQGIMPGSNLDCKFKCEGANAKVYQVSVL